MGKRTGGFDIGGHALHIAIATKKGVKKVYTEPLPEGSVRDGRIVSYEAMGDFIKQTCKKRKIRFDDGAVVLPSGLCFCRRMSVPVMTHEQLMVNLPYEFRDFITSEKDAYFYDYAVLRVLRDANEEPAELDIMAAAALKTTIADYRSMFRRAGIKLHTAIPTEMSFANLLARCQEGHCHCIIDVGHTSVRLYMYNGNRFESSHIIDYGCEALDNAISEALHIDPFIAASYREANHDGCQTIPECESIYQSLAVEIQRAVHFFRYNNPDIELEHIHLIGGGALMEPLRETLENTLSVPIYNASELLDVDGVETEFGLVAAGAALQ